MNLKPKAIPISKLLSKILSNAVRFNKRHLKLIKLCKHAFYFKAYICTELISENLIKLLIICLNVLTCCYNNLLLYIEQKYNLNLLQDKNYQKAN